ncbi:MAG: flagellar protein FlaG [Candidatus Melainabacteria bacterium]|nr:flagellar protein FlaG [Candidatus Melainabacteria bacterium]
MSMDGLPRSAALGSAFDAHAAAAYQSQAAQAYRRKRPIEKSASAIPTHEEENRLGQLSDEDEENAQQEWLNEEERQQVMLFAKIRGLMNISLEEGVAYRFAVAADTGLIELLREDSQAVVLTLTPEEMVSLYKRMERYAGLLTDQSG